MRTIIYLIVSSILLASCYSHKATTKYRSNSHNEAIVVTPQWETEIDPKLKIAPYVLGLGGAAYGYYSAPPLKFDDNEVSNGVTAAFYGVGSFLLSQAISKQLFKSPPKKKYDKKEADKWLYAFNKEERSDYVISEFPKQKYQNLLLLPKNNLDIFLARENQLAEEKERRDEIVSENAGKLFQDLVKRSNEVIKDEFKQSFTKSNRSRTYLKSIGIEVANKSIIHQELHLKDENNPYPFMTMNFGEDFIIMEGEEENGEKVPEYLICTAYDASIKGSNGYYYECYSTYTSEVMDFTVVKQNETYNVRNLTDDPERVVDFFPVSNSVEDSRLFSRERINKAKENIVNSIEFDERLFSTTLDECDKCIKCIDQWGYYQGKKKTSYNTVSVYCNGEKISEWKLYRYESCDDVRQEIEDSNGVRYQHNGKPLLEIGLQSDNLCPNAQIKINN